MCGVTKKVVTSCNVVSLNLSRLIIRYLKTEFGLQLQNNVVSIFNRCCKPNTPVAERMLMKTSLKHVNTVKYRNLHQIEGKYFADSKNKIHRRYLMMTKSACCIELRNIL